MPLVMLQRSTLPPPPSLSSMERPALFLDFDGTLVEIAAGPDAIVGTDGLGTKLERLAERLDGRLALVSGRSISNLGRFLDTMRFHLAGSHGGHVMTDAGRVLREADPLPHGLNQKLSTFASDSGLLYERKAHGAALHYRINPALEPEVAVAAADLAAEFGLVVKTGKCVVELVRPGADKGEAVRIIMQQPDFLDAAPIFVGDDLTDEDGMAAANALGGFGIAVGERPFEHATFHLPTVKDVHEWLAL